MLDTPTGDGVADARLRARSRRMAAACGVVALLLPVAVAGTFVVNAPETFAEAYPASATAARGQVTLAIVLALLPVLAAGHAFWAARQGFLAAAEGAWFSKRFATAIRRFGARLMVAAGIAVLMPTLIGLALTLHAREGERQLVVALSSEPLLGAGLGAVIWLLGDVQARAAALAREHAQIV